MLFSLPNPFITNKQTTFLLQNQDVRMGKYERVSAGTVSILHRIILRVEVEMLGERISSSTGCGKEIR